MNRAYVDLPEYLRWLLRDKAEEGLLSDEEIEFCANAINLLRFGNVLAKLIDIVFPGYEHYGSIENIIYSSFRPGGGVVNVCLSNAAGQIVRLPENNVYNRCVDYEELNFQEIKDIFSTFSYLGFVSFELDAGDMENRIMTFDENFVVFLQLWKWGSRIDE